jgi:hypothetical protein
MKRLPSWYPKNHEAVLFMGDSLYAQNKYAQSDTMFDCEGGSDRPESRTRVRFWGDALLAQDQGKG